MVRKWMKDMSISDGKWTIPWPNISPKLNLLHVLMQPNTCVASNQKNSFTCSFILPFAQLQPEEMESLTEIGRVTAAQWRIQQKIWRSRSSLAEDLVEIWRSQSLFLAKNLAKVLAKILVELQPKSAKFSSDFSIVAAQRFLILVKHLAKILAMSHPKER